MQLQGIHHVTAITADASKNLDFYTRVMGLRFVKKTVNFDAPNYYHLYYGDYAGKPGTVLTFFEFPFMSPGCPGAGMIHRISWEVVGAGALEYWAERLSNERIEVQRSETRLNFNDPEGLALELWLSPEGESDAGMQSVREGKNSNQPAFPLKRLIGVRAFSTKVAESEKILVDTLDFAKESGADFALTGGSKAASIGYDQPPPETGKEGTGTVHHIAWAAEDEEHADWREKVAAADVHVTPIIDRTYFRSIYFREPSGVLFEIATLGPGFTVDEPLDELGNSLKFPERLEKLRPTLEARLKPL